MKKIDLFKNEPLLLNEKPEGSNSMSSRASFMQKKLYEKKSFSNSENAKNKPLDIWYDKILYGRVDTYLNSIQIKKDRLKEIVQKDNTVSAVDFVVDAYLDFLNFWDYLARKEALEKNSPYYSLRVFSGWDDLNVQYYNIMNIYYDKFSLFAKSSGRDSDIKDFKSFIDVFTHFLDSQTPYLPILRTTLTTSRFSNPNISGIVLSLKDEDYSNDKKKYETYINDKNFSVFKETAMKYGFVVDKHAPWRIFADLSSPALKPYMDKYSVNASNFFDLYYEKILYPDLDILKVYIIQFYNAYVVLNPTFNKPEFTICNGRPKIKNNITFREKAPKQVIELQISDDFWLRLYTFIRAREKNLDWNQHEFEQITVKASEFLRGANIRAAIGYIDRKTKQGIVSSQKERNFYFKI